MNATSGKSSSSRTISRQYEFSRLQEQTLACAYEVLIPVISRRIANLRAQRDDIHATSTNASSHQPSGVGA
jgi:hypothetical protein